MTAQSLIRPTAAQNAAMVRSNRARVYAEVQAMRPDVAAAGMACCDAANEPEAEPTPAPLMSQNLGVSILVAAVIVVYLIHFFWGLPA
jgi:hypothetical protein